MPDTSLIPDSGSCPTVLIVDDESDLADNFRLALSGRFQVHATTSPLEALAFCEGPGVQLVLTDYMMEGMNGVELVRKIHAMRPALPCILFSGGLNEEIWTEALNSGCRHVLSKPISLRSVIDLCSRLLTPEEAPPLHVQQLDILESIPWRGDLGRAMRTLAAHLLGNRNLVYLVSPGEAFPIELLHGLLPSLSTHIASAETPAGEGPLYTAGLENLGAEDQNRLAAQLAARQGRTWLIGAAAPPDDLFDQRKLNEALYYRLGQSVVYLPSAGDCPHDSVQLCTWWLASLLPPNQLTLDAQNWLEIQVPSLDWTTLVALLTHAIKLNAGDPLDAFALQRAALAISLGSDLSRISNYTDFSEAYGREFREAWALLQSAAS